MYSLLDPSCFEGSIKKKDYIFHVWALSYDTFPKAAQGDVIRIHRAKVEARNEKLPDFRVFRETDIVVFPLDTNEHHVTAANSFTFTETDLNMVNHLKVWSSEVYLNVDDGKEPDLVTLEKIPCGKPFNLACRLVQHFENEKAVGLWVEDGTVCPLYTCSDSRIEPYNSQDTIDICNSVRLICVHCPKVMVRNLALENGAILFLRGVETITNYSDPNVGNVVQFCAKGSVELLPIQTRYYKTLIRRLEKCKDAIVHAQEGPSGAEYSQTETESMVRSFLEKSVEDRVEGRTPKSKEYNSNEQMIIDAGRTARGMVSNREVLVKDVDLSSSTDVSESETKRRPSTSKEPTVCKRKQVDSDSTRKSGTDRKVRRTCGSQHLSPKKTSVNKQKPLEGSRNRTGFEEGSTDCVMVEIPSDMLEENLCGSLQKELEQEETRLSTLIKPLVFPQGKEVNRIGLLNPIRQTEQTDLNCEENDISFCHVVTSTQKPEVVSSGASNADKLTEMPNAQPLFTTSNESSDLGQKAIPKRKNTCIVHPVNSLSSDMFDNQLGTVTCTSPQPVYRAANEVLDIVTGTSQFADSRNVYSQKITVSQIDETGLGQRKSQVKLMDGSPDFQIRLSLSQTECTDDFMNQCGSEHNVRQGGKKKLKDSTSGTPRKSCRRDDYDSNAHPGYKTRPSASSHRKSESGEDSSGEETLDKQKRKNIMLAEKRSRRTIGKSRKLISSSSSSCEETGELRRPVTEKAKSADANLSNAKTVHEGRKHINSSSNSIEEIEIVEHIDDSDNDSVIVINSPTQMDLLGFLNAIETSESEDVFLNSPADSNFILPEKQFRIKTTIKSLLPNGKSDRDCHNLSDLIIAYCSNCHHLWQYHHFKDSTSNSVRRKKKTTISDFILDGELNGVVNYLCSEDKHSQNMMRLNENQNILDDLDCDERCEMDYTFHYVCPLCKLDGKPDSICLLKPSFYFWMHIAQNNSCLHAMASGIHAEYFLGTKAEHAIRSPEVWKRAEERLSKLIEHGKKQALTLCIRKAQHLNEYYLENTFVVYHDRHILPW